jgi:hypothetical protein
VGNNPANPSSMLRTGWVDPSGNIAIAAVLGAVGAGGVIGGLMGAGGYLLGVAKGDDFSWGGLGKSALKGFASGAAAGLAGFGLGGLLSGLGGFGLFGAVLGGGATGVATSSVAQIVDNLLTPCRKWNDNLDQAVKFGGIIGMVAGGVGYGIQRWLQNRNAVPTWPDAPEEMDEFLGMGGRRIPDGPSTQGRSKVVWEPTNGIKITYEQHPYHPTAPDWHKGPHWHLDTPGMPPHQRYLPGDPIPGY